MSKTEFSDRAAILSELWINYKNDEEFLDFVEYNDLGLPLAFAIANEIVVCTPAAAAFIDETFELLLQCLEIDEDTGFENVEDLLGLDSDG